MYKLSEIIGNKVAISCKTVNEFNDMLDLLYSRGVMWIGGDKANEAHCKRYYTIDKVDTCISMSSRYLGHADFGWYKKEGYTIIPASQFIADNSGPVEVSESKLTAKDIAWLNKLANHVGVRMSGMKEIAATLTGDEAIQAQAVINAYSDAINFTNVLVNFPNVLKK